MDTFLARQASVVQGTLSGLDRVRIRGTQRWLASERGMRSWLWRQPVLLNDYKDIIQNVNPIITVAINRRSHRKQRLPIIVSFLPLPERYRM